MTGQPNKAMRNFPTLSIIIITSVLLACAFLPAHYFRYPYIFSRILDALHFPAGFVLFVITYAALPKRQYTAHALFFFASLIFAAVEIFQPYVGRTASWSDFMVSLVGVTLAWLWTIGKQVSLKSISYIIVPIVISGTIWLLKPGGLAAWQAYQIHQLFPVLANFESSAHGIIAPLWRSNIELRPHDTLGPNSDHYLYYRKQGNRWSGLELKVIQQDWSPHTNICFDARGDLPNTKLLVRFDDQLSTNSQTSSTQTVTIYPQWKTYCINTQQLITPGKRSLDTASMKKLIFFIDGHKPSKGFSLDNIEIK